MSARPSKPLKELVDDFNAALKVNDFDALNVAEAALDKVVHTRLRRMKYKGFPIRELEHLLDALPEDYDSKVMGRVFDLLDSKSPIERAGG